MLSFIYIVAGTYTNFRLPFCLLLLYYMQETDKVSTESYRPKIRTEKEK